MSEQPAEQRTAIRLVVAGRVQGVGFRPAVARLAAELGLAGEARNTSFGVEVWLEGRTLAIDEFQRRLPAQVPPLGSIRRMEVVEASPAGRLNFRIVPGSREGPVATPPPPDVAVCQSCLSEVGDPANRRFHYPFTSCAQCGPRYSILHSLPYERRATSMSAFELCRECQDEFEQPSNSRFHAETIACASCGPHCWLTAASGQLVAERQAAMEGAVAALARGQIVGLRGIGGYQLLVNATSDAAVRRLRERKCRPAKPLAVLVHSLKAARSLAWIDAAAEDALTRPAGCIVIVPARHDSPLAPAVHSGLCEVGLMLPTSPLHWILAGKCPPLVATSGNREGEPLEYVSDNAQAQLSGIADFLVDHDRPIARPIDDGVMKMIAGKPVTLRLARGLAPLPLDIDSLGGAPKNHSVLAVGGQQNNALAVSCGSQAILGPHIGDLDELRTCERWHAQRRDLLSLLCTEPSIIAHDRHPDYYSTRWAVESGLPTVGVQHHHAHVAAGMLEHGWLDREVLGVAWDGTGWGPDGTIWGGEFLIATAARFRRVARFRPFSLPGGEAAIRQPWRVAVTLLADSLGQEDALAFFTRRGWEAEPLAQALRVSSRPELSPRTSSVGRLFDAVATIVLPPHSTSEGQSRFEGELAMLLESACQWPADASGADDERAYAIPLIGPERDELDWRPLIAAIVEDCRAGVAPLKIARRFHAALSASIVAVSATRGHLPIVLGGGVFQNRVLTEMILRRFANRRQPLGLPRVIPPGDGGLAAGQLAVALATLGNQQPCV